MSYLIAIDGTDASGKKTQTALLCDYLTTEGYAVKSISFPDYVDDSSMLVRMYLNGAFGEHPEDTGAYAASVFFAVDRYASFMRKWKSDYQKQNQVILLDRYTTSNAIHQLSKLESDTEKESFLAWLYDFEFIKLALPVPDMTLFLDMPPEVSLSLLQKRTDDTGAKKDIHELDEEFLRRSYKAAQFACEKWGWTKIACSEKEQPKEVAKIQQSIAQVVTNALIANGIGKIAMSTQS